MKNFQLTVIFVLILFLAISCNEKECYSCYEGPWSFKIAILDSMNRDLLKPNSPTELKLDKVLFSSGEVLKYNITDIFGGDVKVQIYFIDISDKIFDQKSLDQICTLFFFYHNSIPNDTIAIQQGKNTIFDSDGCGCAYYVLKSIKYNGKLITEFDTVYQTGAAIIRK